MAHKIESITATIPVVGQSYTDLRPTIVGKDIEELRAGLVEVAELAGNKAFVDRMSKDPSSSEKPRTGALVSSRRVCFEGQCLDYDEENHVYYDEKGEKYMSGSAFASQFEEPFKAELIATKLSKTRGKSIDDILAGWESKAETSRAWGTAIHKAMETALKYEELPNDEYLKALVEDYLEQTKGDVQYAEQFVMDKDRKMCGFVDALVELNKKKKTCIIRDWKTGDIFKKIKLTEEAKEKWPKLREETISIYQLQLSFYASALKGRGYTVEGLEVWAKVGDHWVKNKLEVLEIA